MSLRVVRQKYDSDCCVAALSCITGIPYPRCLQAAIRIGFRPNVQKGLHDGDLLDELKAPFDVTHFRKKYRIDRLSGVHHRSNFRVKWGLPRPGIHAFLTVPSLNRTNRGVGGGLVWHAVVAKDGEIMDPSPNIRYQSFAQAWKVALGWTEYERVRHG